MMVNKEDLREVLRNVEDAEQSNFEFAVGRHISEENILPNFEIEDLGTVNVPVSIKDLNRLKKMSEAAYCCHENIKITGTGKLKRNSWQLNAARIHYQSNNAETFFRHTVFSLAKDGLRKLGVIAKELNLIDVVPTGMLILERGGYAPIHCDNNEHEPGLFGLMTIQVPVKNGYEGGIFKVNHQGQCRMFDHSNSSKKSFYTTIFYAGCEHELTEVTNGWRLVFTFSLLWKWTRSLFVPIADTSLMFAANEIERIMSPWRLPCSQRCVAIPLEHNYTSANLSFSGLKGSDRLTASLLRSVNFIDLHLASVYSRIKLISSIENSLEPQMEQEYYTGHWVASCTDSPFKFQGLEIDFDSEVIYPMVRRSQINLDNTESPHLTSREVVDVHQLESSMKYIYCKALLVVWPKTSTIDLACAYGFVGALDLLEYLVRTTPAEEVLFVLGRTVAFCCANPRLVWCNTSYHLKRKPVPLPGQVTYRLFQLCIDLDSPEQGLILLNLISEDFPASPTQTSPRNYQSDVETKEIEGLQNNQVANALAKLIAMAGWNSCKEAISRFLTPVRIAQQLEPLTVLVTSLIGYQGLHINATNIADQLCPILFTSPSCWKSSTCKTAAEMIFRLEGINESSNSQRIADYLKFAQSIQTGVLCSVVVYIHQKLIQLIKKNPHLQDFCRELCQVLVQRDLGSLRLVSEKDDLIIIDVLKYFLWMSNCSILHQFVEKVTMPTKGNNVCLQALLASSSVWKACLATEIGKEILLVLIDCRLKELSLLQHPIFSWQQPEAKLPNCPEVENFLRSSKLSTNVSEKFLNMHQAHNWVVATFGLGIEVLSRANSQFCVNHRFSATIRVKKVAGGSFVCEITKNRLLYEYDVVEFKSRQQEIGDLIETRRVALSDEPSTHRNKRVKFDFS